MGCRSISLAALFLFGLVACAADTADSEAVDDELTLSRKAPPGKNRPLTDVDPDKDADPEAPSPPEDPALPPAKRLQLVTTYAPHLHLHPDDKNRPANVDWYLPRVTMRFNHNNCPDHEILGKGHVTQASLVAQTHEDNGGGAFSFCRHDSKKAVGSAESEHFFLEVSDAATYNGAPRAQWKTYVVWRPREGGLVDIEYWFFYPYNDGFALFNHEADWEHVRVRVDPKSNGGRGRVILTFLSEHDGGTTFQAGDPNLAMDGTHPVVYAAKGTHANYAKPGTYDIEGTHGVAKDNVKAAPAADVWKTENTVLLVGTRAKPENGQVFIKFWGRWGQIGNLPETDGITRHFP